MELNLDLWPKQGEALRDLTNPNIEVLGYGGARGGGKIVADGSFVLTPFGFKPGRSLKVGDLICSSNGGTQKIIQIKPRVTLKRWTVKFSDGTSLPVAEDHLWTAWRSCKSRKIRNIRVSGERSAEVVETKTLKDWLDRGYTPQVPVPKPVAFNRTTKRRLLDPYLLGALLGDGHLSEDMNITLSTSTDDRQHWVSEFSSNFEVSTKTESTVRFIGDSQKIIRKSLKTLGLLGKHSWAKFIPEVYKLSSVESRLELIRGLMDTDGYNAPDKGGCYYYSVSKSLAEDVAWVLRSLGCVVSVTTKVGTYHGVKKRKCYCLYIASSDPDSLFKMGRKKHGKICHSPNKRVVEVEVGGTVTGRCITVSDTCGLYITDDFIVTHNSHLVRVYLIARALKYKNSRHLLIRKTFPELQRNHIDRFLSEFVSIGLCKYVERRHQLVFESTGSIIELGYCEGERDLIRFQGGEYDTICLDEAQFHTKKVFQDLRACLRTASDSGINPKYLLTFNPGGIGHGWLKRLFIDKNFDEGERPENFKFIKALVHDNPSIVNNDPAYIARLEALPEPQRSAMLNGDFSVFEGQFYEVSPLSLENPFEIEESECMERLYGSLDHGISHYTSFGLWYLDRKGNMHRLFSYLNSGGTTQTHADEICQRIAAFPYTKGQFPVKIFADPSMWTKQRINEDTIRANIDEYIDRFREARARTVFERANNDKVNGAAILRQHLAETYGMPKVFYWSGYNNTWVESLTSVPTDKNNRDIPEKVDGDDVADETRYGVLGMYSVEAVKRKTDQIRLKTDKILDQMEQTDWYNL